MTDDFVTVSNAIDKYSAEIGSLDTLFMQGRTLVQEGKIAEGFSVLHEIFKLNPNHFQTLELLGDLSSKFGKAQAAREMWSASLCFQPANQVLRNKLELQEIPDLTGLRRFGKPVDCSIIIPVFNQIQYTKRCLDFIQKNTPKDCYEIIVVDNHSNDGTKEFLRGLANLRVIRNEANLGFAKACNQGAGAASHEFILFLNNDVEVQKGWLTPLVMTLLQDTEVAVVGSKLLYSKGKIQHAGVITVEDAVKSRSLIPWHVYYRLDGTLPEANIPREYSCVTGACLLTRKSVFEQLGKFDEAYWNGYEDVDYCYKVGTAGHKIVYRPESVAIHYESQSGSERCVSDVENFAKLVAKWHGKIPVDIRRWGVRKRDFLRPFKNYQI